MGFPEVLEKLDGRFEEGFGHALREVVNARNDDQVWQQARTMLTKEGAELAEAIGKSFADEFNAAIGFQREPDDWFKVTLGSVDRSRIRVTFWKCNGDIIRFIATNSDLVQLVNHLLGGLGSRLVSVDKADKAELAELKEWGDRMLALPDEPPARLLKEG